MEATDLLGDCSCCAVIAFTLVLHGVKEIIDFNIGNTNTETEKQHSQTARSRSNDKLLTTRVSPQPRAEAGGSLLNPCAPPCPIM